MDIMSDAGPRLIVLQYQSLVSSDCSLFHCCSLMAVVLYVAVRDPQIFPPPHVARESSRLSMQPYIVSTLGWCYQGQYYCVLGL